MKQNALTTFITIALLLCSHLSATAQSDVTDQYLTNAEFDNTADFVSSIVYTYANDANANGGVSSCQPVSHWAPDATGDAKAGGVFGFGSGYGLSGGGYVAPDADAQGRAHRAGDGQERGAGHDKGAPAHAAPEGQRPRAES